MIETSFLKLPLAKLIFLRLVEFNSMTNGRKWQVGPYTHNIFQHFPWASCMLHVMKLWNRINESDRLDHERMIYSTIINEHHACCMYVMLLWHHQNPWHGRITDVYLQNKLLCGQALSSESMVAHSVCTNPLCGQAYWEISAPYSGSKTLMFSYDVNCHDNQTTVDTDCACFKVHVADLKIGF